MGGGESVGLLSGLPATPLVLGRKNWYGPSMSTLLNNCRGTRVSRTAMRPMCSGEPTFAEGISCFGRPLHVFCAGTWGTASAARKAGPILDRLAVRTIRSNFSFGSKTATDSSGTRAEGFGGYGEFVPAGDAI